MAIVALTESSAVFVYILTHKPNYWVFNCYQPIQIGFISWVMYKLTKPFFNSKWLIISFAVISFIIFISENYNSGFLNWSKITKTYFSIFTVIEALLFYYYLLQQESNISITRYPPFWIITGIFFFYFVSITSNLFYDTLSSINKNLTKPIRSTIFLVLNIILYGCWTYAFIWKKKTAISSTQ